MKERPILFSGGMVRANLEGRKTQTRRVLSPQPLHVEVSENWLEGVPGSGADQVQSSRPFAGSRPAVWFRFDTETNARIDWHRQFWQPYKRTKFRLKWSEYRLFAWKEVASICPYGQPGDRLWVREAWGGDDICGVAYRADHPEWPRFRGHGEQPDGPWRPSIHMPRWACRLILEITGIGVERLQDITEADARAEGAVEWFHALPDAQQAEVLRHTSLPLDAGKESPSARDCFFMLWDSINAKRAPCRANPWVWVVKYKRVEGETK